MVIFQLKETPVFRKRDGDWLLNATRRRKKIVLGAPRKMGNDSKNESWMEAIQAQKRKIQKSLINEEGNVKKKPLLCWLSC